MLFADCIDLYMPFQIVSILPFNADTLNWSNSRKSCLLSPGWVVTSSPPMQTAIGPADAKPVPQSPMSVLYAPANWAFKPSTVLTAKSPTSNPLGSSSRNFLQLVSEA